MRVPPVFPLVTGDPSSFLRYGGQSLDSRWLLEKVWRAAASASELKKFIMPSLLIKLSKTKKKQNIFKV